MEQGSTTSSNMERPQGSSTPVGKSNDISGQKTSTSETQKSLELTKKVPEDASSDFGELIPIESGSTVKLPIPGTSNSMTLNFSNDVLDQVNIDRKFSSRHLNNTTF
jgi:hypothetical protein